VHVLTQGGARGVLDRVEPERGEHRHACRLSRTALAQT
jgi:hypothetical protein